MIGLGRFGSRWTFFQGGVLLNGLMILFDFPPFLVARLELIAGYGGVTANQVQATSGAVFVCEDHLGEL